MPASKLPSATAEVKSEPKVKKDPLKIRIALFFDGTLNNRLNIAEREKDEIGLENKAKAKYRKDPSNSYDNGRTNIAIMEPHISDKKNDYSGEYDFVFKHYIEGQGTFNYEKDSVWGYAFAIGESGVPSRAEQGIRKAADTLINNEDIDYERQYIEKLTIDVFGFSRGAATARYAIHVILYGRILNVDDFGNVSYEYRPMAQRLREMFLQTDDKAVQIQFAGLYDTVLSYMASQYVGWTTNALKQKSVVNAKKVLHLAAADEHRKDFPLHRIVSAVKKGVGEEYFLPGVHSDVGGSYNMANQIVLRQKEEEFEKQAKKLSEEERKKEKENLQKKYAMRSSGEGKKDEPLVFNWKGDPKNGVMVINENDTMKYIEKDMNDLIAQGWYASDEIKAHTIEPNDVSEWPTYVLTAWRQNINSAYNNIPLKIMAKYAREQNLKINPQLEDIANGIIQPYEELVSLEQTIKNYMESHKNTSKPGDWIDEYGEQNTDELKKIRHGYFHFSASKWSAGYKPNLVWDEKDWKFLRRRYYYNA